MLIPVYEIYAAHYKSIQKQNEHHDKVLKVINSCETLEQVEVATNMYFQYESIYSYDYTDELFDALCIKRNEFKAEVVF